MMNPSPHQQRNEMSPSMKSPLLGAAPPGILSPPDKGEFRNFMQTLPPPPELLDNKICPVSHNVSSFIQRFNSNCQTKLFLLS